MTVLTGHYALAQCGTWLPGDGIPGLDGPAYAFTTWDPDGPGPLTDVLVVGGAFTAAGNVMGRNIATWNGAAWHALGGGMNGAVHALTVYNGSLIAGGTFTTAGGASANFIAQWNA